MVSLLLSHGAHPFFSTVYKDSLSYSGAAQRGCYRYTYADKSCISLVSVSHFLLNGCGPFFHEVIRVECCPKHIVVLNTNNFYALRFSYKCSANTKLLLSF